MASYGLINIQKCLPLSYQLQKKVTSDIQILAVYKNFSTLTC